VEHKDAYFHEFDSYELPIPEKLNNPFYVQISPLGKKAFEHFREHLLTHPMVEKHFNADGVGKMFGLLVVKNLVGKIGYLAAFSGKLNDCVNIPGFVLPVFDTLVYDGFYKTGERILDDINRAVEVLQQSPDYLDKIQELNSLKISHQEEIEDKKKEIKLAKASRKVQRIGASADLLQQLNQESSKEQLWLRLRKKEMIRQQMELQLEIDAFEAKIHNLKNERKRLSQQLQQQLFENYTFLNAKRENKNLLDIFKSFGIDVPPSGAGECAAPKLFQHAFEKGYVPVELVEFWWGPSPPSQIRVHGKFYPCCRSKCEPILHHMLSSTEIQKPPLLNEENRLKEIEVLYQDEYLAVLNKPNNVLSVPGKVQTLTIMDYLPILFPNAERPMLVHRLDRATSGILLVAMNEKVYVKLQQQFVKRSVQKKYLALLDGVIEKKSGIIDLPLRVDLDNRPQQLVCYEHGLPSQTRFEVLEIQGNRTKIAFYPVTGRTHQLRVHAAHPSGLNTPIVGDDLYGSVADRLYLHAEELRFKHPVSGAEMVICCEAPF
jgi:tRNA pseudouridine32 synthase/23S rRNA pseudouridine746 synthase